MTIRRSATDGDLTVTVRVEDDLDAVYAVSREGDRYVLTLGPASTSGLQLALRALYEGELLAAPS